MQLKSHDLEKKLHCQLLEAWWSVLATDSLGRFICWGDTLTGKTIIWCVCVSVCVFFHLKVVVGFFKTCAGESESESGGSTLSEMLFFLDDLWSDWTWNPHYCSFCQGHFLLLHLTRVTCLL